MTDPFTILAAELQTLQKELNATTSPEAHAALLNEVRAKLKELDETVKRRLETVYGLTAATSKRSVQSFDIFERLPGGGVLWRGLASGEDNAATKLSELAKGTANELFACDLQTKRTIATTNSPPGERADDVNLLSSEKSNGAQG